MATLGFRQQSAEGRQDCLQKRRKKTALHGQALVNPGDILTADAI